MASKQPYDDWKIKQVKISQLRLDPENPRLQNPSPDNDQRAILRELIEKDKVESLAKAMVRQGYYPTENMLVIQETPTRYIVLEGNRRAAALKALTNPLSVPPARKGRFEALQREGAGRIPETVRVVVAPDRLSVRPIILNRHTSPNIEQWTPVAQSNYIDAMVKEGFSAEQIAQELGVPVPDFLRKFRNGKVYQRIRTLPMDDDTRAIVSDNEKFKPSGILRLFENSAAREWLGIVPDDVAGFKIKSKADEFEKAMTKIVTDVAHRRISTRNLNTSEGIEKYLKQIEDLKPTQRPGRSAPISKPAPKPKVSNVIATPRRTSTGKKSLLPGDIVCDLDEPRIHSVIEELKKIDVAKYPNAAALLYRSLLDLGVSSYVDNMKLTQTLITQVSGKGAKRPREWMPSLDQMLNYLCNTADPDHFPLAPTALKAVRRFLSDKSHQDTMEGLNGFAHNRFNIPSVECLTGIAAKLQPVLELVLQKPVGPRS